MIDRSIDRNNVCVMLDMVDFFVKYKHVWSHLCQTNSARAMLCSCTVA